MKFQKLKDVLRFFYLFVFFLFDGYCFSVCADLIIFWQLKINPAQAVMFIVFRIRSLY